MKTIKDIMNLREVTPHKFSKVVPLECPDPQLIYGLELEIESASSEWTVSGMAHTEDGSLRNNGLEFLTSPMTYSNLSFCLNNFFQRSKVTEANYSERTSVHVHTNVQDLTTDQLATICAIYQVVEGILFQYVGKDRDTNIFCVPWSQTMLNYGVIENIQNDTVSLRSWQKYTALNLLPIFTLGTIEWRHMAGTHDKDHILNWCALIGQIFAWARKHSLGETLEMLKSLNSTSHYQQALDSVFQQNGKLLSHIPNVEGLLEEGVLNLKYMLMNNKITQANPTEVHVAMHEDAPWREQAAIPVNPWEAIRAEVRRREAEAANALGVGEAERIMAHADEVRRQPAAPVPRPPRRGQIVPQEVQRFARGGVPQAWVDEDQPDPDNVPF